MTTNDEDKTMMTTTNDEDETMMTTNDEDETTMMTNDEDETTMTTNDEDETMMTTTMTSTKTMMTMTMTIMMMTTSENSAITNVLCFISGGRMFHTATRLNNNNILIYGGRTSPSKPCAETILLSLEDKDESESSNCTNDNVNCLPETEYKNSQDSQSSYALKKSYKHMVLSCQGDIPQPRWRHSATHVVLPDGTQIILFFCV